MGRLRLVFLAFELWEVILALTPILLAAAWFIFRNYLVTQNDFLLKFKPTIDSITLVVAIGSLVVGYINLMNELNKLKEKIESPIPMTTKGNGEIYMRSCPKPIDSECPPIVRLPPRTPVTINPEVSYFTDRKSGSRSRWRKIKVQSYEGWVNESLLWPADNVSIR